MSERARLPLALTIGEPAGIGPDLTLAIWRRRVELDLPAFYLIADPDFLNTRARVLDLAVPVAIVTPAQAPAAFERALPVVPLGLAVTAAPGKPDATSAPAAIASIRRAVSDVMAAKLRPSSPIRSPRTCFIVPALPNPATPNFSPRSPVKPPASRSSR
jgi:4-hydroxythreonine-4-phosphate dehydrogenase